MIIYSFLIKNYSEFSNFFLRENKHKNAITFIPCECAILQRYSTVSFASPSLIYTYVYHSRHNRSFMVMVCQPNDDSTSSTSSLQTEVIEFVASIRVIFGHCVESPSRCYLSRLELSAEISSCPISSECCVESNWLQWANIPLPLGFESAPYPAWLLIIEHRMRMENGEGFTMRNSIFCTVYLADP